MQRRSRGFDLDAARARIDRQQAQAIMLAATLRDRGDHDRAAYWTGVHAELQRDRATLDERAERWLAP